MHSAIDEFRAAMLVLAVLAAGALAAPADGPLGNTAAICRRKLRLDKSVTMNELFELAFTAGL